MSLNRSLACITLMAAGSACSAPQIVCPPKYPGQSKPAGLAGASVFEGVHEKQVDLMPDLENSEWDVSLNQKSARERGESMYLVCRYEGIGSTVTLKIPGGATFCKVEGTSSGLAAWCRQPARSAKTGAR